MIGTHRGKIAILTLAIALTTASTPFARTPQGRNPVATTPHFAFHSDFATNLNDALMEAGRARNKGNPELFQSGAEQSCFAELAPSARAGWNHAVDFYAEIISPAARFARFR